MDWWLLSFFLGAILSLFLPIVPEIFQLFLLLLLSLGLFYYKPLQKCAAMLLGAVWVLYGAHQYFSAKQQLFDDISHQIAKAKSQTIQVKGKVLSLQDYGEHLGNDKKLDAKTPAVSTSDKKLRFNFEIIQISNKVLAKPVIVRLSWQAPSFSIAQGQVLSLRVKLKPSHSMANLAAFNYKTWLISKNIVATGYVVNQSKTLSGSNHKVLENNQSLRQRLFFQYQQLLPEQGKYQGILLALGFGDRKQLSPRQWQVLQATGTSHLIAISGLHIGLVASFSYVLCMLLISILPLKHDSWPLLNTRYFAILLSLCCAVAYGFLAGFSTPTLRALVMLFIFWFSQLCLIHLSYLRWLLLTVFAIILLSPLSLMTASFWLSLTAVALIFSVLWRFRAYFSADHKLLTFFKGLIIVQLALTVFLLPLSALFFSQIPLLALPANLIAVPFMSFIVIPITLVSVVSSVVFPSLAVFLIELASYALELIWLWLEFLANLPFAVVKLSNTLSQLIMVTVTLVLLMTMTDFTYPWRSQFFTTWLNLGKVSTVLLCGVLLSGSGLVDGSNLVEDKKRTINHASLPITWQLHLIDVGHGLSILITQGDKALLYDTGPSYRGGFNMADAAILPYLQHLGIRQLDALVLSHGDNDHSGGLAQLANELTIKRLLTNVSVPEEIAIDSVSCQQGDSFVWQALTFEVLWPSKARLSTTLSATDGKQKNDDSCVLLISDGFSKVLVTGDISKKVEAKLIAHYPELEVDILTVPHHGSKTSSSDIFLASLKPSLAIVSAGFNNRWNMPVPEVKKRYRQHDIQLLNSAELGMIVIDFSQQGWVTGNFREDFRSFWIAI